MEQDMWEERQFYINKKEKAKTDVRSYKKQAITKKYLSKKEVAVTIDKREEEKYKLD